MNADILIIPLKKADGKLGKDRNGNCKEASSSECRNKLTGMLMTKGILNWKNTEDAECTKSSSGSETSCNDSIDDCKIDTKRGINSNGCCVHATGLQCRNKDSGKLEVAGTDFSWKDKNNAECKSMSK